MEDKIDINSESMQLFQFIKTFNNPKQLIDVM